MKTTDRLKIAKAKLALTKPVPDISFVKNDEVQQDITQIKQTITNLAIDNQQLKNEIMSTIAEQLLSLKPKDYLAAIEQINTNLIKLNRADETLNIVAAIKNIKIPESNTPVVKVAPTPVTIVKNDDDIYSRYSFSDKSTEVDGDYIGYLNSFGNWFIQRIAQPNDKTYRSRFSAGKNDYSANWNKRVKLTYELRHKVDII